jgi:ribose transport system permease protein
MTAPDVTPAARPRSGLAGLAVLRAVPPIWVILVLVFAGIFWRDPSFAEPPSMLAFLKRSAPLAVLALGQMFVIIAGEFDLSVGALVTACVIVAAKLTEGDPARTWWIILLLLVIGALVGAVNGLVTTLLRVPSFIATLGMMLVLGGAAFLWTGGSPTGALAANFRRFGRGGWGSPSGWGQVPYAAMVLVVIAAIAVVLLHYTRFGHQVFATGGGARAAALSGVAVGRVRVLAFVISGLSAAITAILLAGYAGLSADAGAGYEFQAISAVVLGGAVLGGGRGAAIAVLGGALTLQAIFTLLNLLGMAAPLRNTVQGLLIVAAVAFAARRLRNTG